MSVADISRAQLDLPGIIRGRHSVRRYQDRPVPRELVLEVLDAGRWAPSPHGRQPWRFVVLTRPAPKQTLADAMGDQWRRQLALDGQDTETVEIRRRKSHERII